MRRKLCVLYLLSFAHGAHRLRVVTGMSAVARTNTADGRTTNQAVEAARLVAMVGTSRVRSPPSHLQLSPAVGQRRQLVLRSVLGVWVGTDVAYVQLAVRADPRRLAGDVRLRRGRSRGWVDLAVDWETTRLTVPLHDTLEGAGRRQGGHATVDDDDAGTGWTADDRLRGRTGTGLIDDGGRRTETAEGAARPRHDTGVRLADYTKSIATVMFATRVSRRRHNRCSVISPGRRRSPSPGADQRRQRRRRGRHRPGRDGLDPGGSAVAAQRVPAGG